VTVHERAISISASRMTTRGRLFKIESVHRLRSQLSLARRSTLSGNETTNAARKRLTFNVQPMHIRCIIANGAFRSATHESIYDQAFIIQRRYGRLRLYNSTWPLRRTRIPRSPLRGRKLTSTYRRRSHTRAVGAREPDSPQKFAFHILGVSHRNG